MVCWHFAFAVPSTTYVTQPCDVALERLAVHLLLHFTAETGCHIWLDSCH